jgi:hypothetical protein
VGRYSYRLLPEGALAPNRAGLDPLTSPGAFNRALRADLEALFLPGHTGLATQGRQQPAAAASLVPAEGGNLAAAKLPERIRRAIGSNHRQAAASVPDLRSLHRRLPNVKSSELLSPPQAFKTPKEPAFRCPVLLSLEPLVAFKETGWLPDIESLCEAG